MSYCPISEGESDRSSKALSTDNETLFGVFLGNCSSEMSKPSSLTVEGIFFAKSSSQILIGQQIHVCCFRPLTLCQCRHLLCACSHPVPEPWDETCNQGSPSTRSAGDSTAMRQRSPGSECICRVPCVINGSGQSCYEKLMRAGA